MVVTFLIAAFFSFIGSIPPGTLNLTILQLGLEKRISIAWRFALAAVVVEYPYAWLAVKFEKLILSSPVITDNFKLIAACVMTALGAFNILAGNKPTKLRQRFEASGFRRGIILSLLNPMAIPFWIGITAFLESRGWIELSAPLILHSYLAGVAIGALALLMCLAYAAQGLSHSLQHRPWIKKIPGFTLLALGIYAFIDYLF